MTRRETGIRGEKLAQEFLKKKGYRILETNYRCPAGEMDIIAEYKGCLVFIEVRTKTSHEFGSPAESITQAKAERLQNVAMYYEQSHENLPPLRRIDFVGIELSKDGRPDRIELIENAVS